MPPQYNRRSSGPASSTPGPVQRSFQQQDLGTRPEATEGPDMSNAQMFGSLQKALNVGVQAVGQYRAAVKQEKSAELARRLEETKLAYGRGEATMADYDAIMAEYGTDDESKTLIMRGMSQAEYYSRMAVAGNKVASELFAGFDTEASRQAFIETLPGEAPLDEELADAFEDMARKELGNEIFDGMDENDRRQMLRYGLREFSDELAEVNREVQIRAKAAEQQSLDRTTKAMVASLGDGEATPEKMAELTDLVLRSSGGNVKRAMSAMASKMSTLSLSDFDKAISVLDPDLLEMDDTVAAIQQTRAQIISNMVGQSRDIANNTAYSRSGVGADFVNENPDVPADAVADTMIHIRMDELGLDFDDPQERALVANAMQKDIESALKMKAAYEENLDVIENLRQGRPVSPEQLTQVYEAHFEDIRGVMKEAGGMSLEDVYTQVPRLSAMASQWSGLVGSTESGMVEPPIPAELAADISNGLRSDNAAKRLAAIALWKGLGGQHNGNLTGKMTPQEIATAVSVEYIMGKHAAASGDADTPVDGGLFFAPGLSELQTAQLNELLFLNVTDPGDVGGAAWSGQKQAISEAYVEEFGAEAAEMFDTLPAPVQDVISSLLANRGDSPEELRGAVAQTRGYLASMGFTTYRNSEGSTPQFVRDPLGRLGGYTASTRPASDMVMRMIKEVGNEAMFGTEIPGIDRLLEVGAVSVNLVTNTSLDPLSPYAYFQIAFTDDAGEYKDAGGFSGLRPISWEKLPPMIPEGYITFDPTKPFRATGMNEVDAKLRQQMPAEQGPSSKEREVDAVRSDEDYNPNMPGPIEDGRAF